MRERSEDAAVAETSRTPPRAGGMTCADTVYHAIDLRFTLSIGVTRSVGLVEEQAGPD